MSSSRNSAAGGLILALFSFIGLAQAVHAGPAPVSVTSPDGKVAIVIAVGDAGQLTWRASIDGKPVIEPSAMGIVVDGVNLGIGVDIQKTERYRVNETYSWYGGHRTGVNLANGARIALRHRASATAYVVEARASDDAVAFRVVVEGTGRRVPDAATSFRVPAGSIVWSHGLRDHYEALYERRTIEDLREGDWAAPPITVKLPGNAGYAAITEADLRNYAGMALQADGRGGLLEKLGHDHPPGYPYTLRFGEDNARRLAVAAPVDGTNHHALARRDRRS